MITSFLRVFLLLLLAASPLWAHDILLLPSLGVATTDFALAIKYGHPGDYSLPNQEKIYQLDLFPADDGPPVSLLPKIKAGSADTLSVTSWGDALGRGGIIGARFDNGYYAEVDKDHYYNTSKRELPGAMKSGHYLKFAKALVPALAPGSPRLPHFDRLLGYRLELAPQADPFALKPGDELPVLVLFDGKPVEAGVEVDIISGDFPMTKGMELPTFKTDAHGIARVKLERAGTQSLGADRVVSPSMDPQLADVDNYASSLSFVLPNP